MSPLVTVVIPCYNAEKWIEECIQSVLKQDYKPIEIIVIDDCSIDRSVQKIWQYPIRLIRNESNTGECKTSSIGFLKARGKYICRLSADDMFVKDDHITRQVKEMEKTNADWCYNNINLVGKTLDASIEVQGSWIHIPIRNSSKLFCIFDNTMLKFQNICYLITIMGNPINSSTLMIRANTYSKLLSWDSNLRSCCDGMLIGKMFLCGLKARAIPTIGSFYRIHSGQATNTEASNRDLFFVRSRLKNEIINNNHPLWMKIIVRLI